MLTFNAFPLFTLQWKRKMENLFSSSTVYETFSPFNMMLCFSGFWYTGKLNASLDGTKMILSVLYSVLFVTFAIMNALWGEQEPTSADSFLLKGGWHNLFLSEFFFLPIMIWSNFHHRRRINDCLVLIEQYDVVCQVSFCLKSFGVQKILIECLNVVAA